jgi:hypothetical protein
MNKNSDSNVDGTIVAIGAPTESTSYYGYIKVFQYDSTSADWTQMGSTITTTNLGSGFGENLVLSSDGTRLTAIETNTGDLYVYTYTTDWNLLTSFDVNTTLSIRGDNANYDTITGISSTGTRILIGDHRYNVDGMSYPGAAMVVDIGGTLSYEVVNQTMYNSVRIGLEDRYQLDWCSLDVSGNIYTTGNLYVDEADISLNGNLYTSGNVSIGATDSLGYSLYVAGNSYTTGSATSSDDRLKHNEINIENALETIRKLQPKHYYKTTEMYDENHHFSFDTSGNMVDICGNILPVPPEEDGFIAQEVNDIPELRFLVSQGTETTPYALNYNSMFTRSVKALQELDVELQAEKIKTALLESRLSDILTRLDNLEKT